MIRQAPPSLLTLCFLGWAMLLGNPFSSAPPQAYDVTTRRGGGGGGGMFWAVEAAYPGPDHWDIVSPGFTPDEDTYTRAYTEEFELFGSEDEEAECGDGICNIVQGETCGTCAEDCGECEIHSIPTQCVNPGQLAYTWDDGPSEATWGLLETLAEYGVRATFFVCGRFARQYPEILQQMIKDGHQIGSHTWSHRSLGDGHTQTRDDLGPQTLDEVRAEMVFTDFAVYDAVGVLPIALRPPYLQMNDATRAALETMGYFPVNINTDGIDYMDYSNTEQIVSDMKNGFYAAQEHGSWITLQHDIFDFSAEAAKEIIPFLLDQGVEFVTISECLGIDAYRHEEASPYLRPGLQPEHNPRYTPPAPEPEDLPDDVDGDQGQMSGSAAGLRAWGGGETSWVVAVLTQLAMVALFLTPLVAYEVVI